MLDNDAADKIGDVISADDFYSDAHRIVYRHIVQLIADGKPADVVTRVRSAGIDAEARLRRRPRVSRRARAERADRREHPALREHRARALDPAPARGDGDRDRRIRVQPARPQREDGARRGRGEGPAHRRAGLARRAELPGYRQAARERRRADRDAVQPRRSVGRHRRAHRLRRSRPDDVGLPAGRSRRRRRTTEHGEGAAARCACAHAERLEDDGRSYGRRRTRVDRRSAILRERCLSAGRAPGARPSRFMPARSWKSAIASRVLVPSTPSILPI